MPVASTDEIMRSWYSAVCYAAHGAKALYIVNGGDKRLATCGDHLSRAVREVAHLEHPPQLKVTVWVRPS